MALIRGEAGIARTSRARYHVGLTPDAVIDAAVELSQGTGLRGWTLRDLAQVLDVAPSVVYHHIGGRELLRHRVVERVLSMVEFPTTVMPWREWFRAALFPARPVLARYPGTARWLLLHGPVFASMAPVVDSGVASLQDAGFGRDTGAAYTALFNTAMMTIAAADDRLEHEDESVRDHAALMQGLSEAAGSSPGIALLSRDVMTQFTGSPEAAVAARDTYYRYVIERLMDGLESSLSGR